MRGGRVARGGGSLGFGGAGRKAIQSLRLRLHSGLRQSGGVCDAAVFGTAEAVPLRGFRGLGGGWVGEFASHLCLKCES